MNLENKIEAEKPGNCLLRKTQIRSRTLRQDIEPSLDLVSLHYKFDYGKTIIKRKEEGDAL